MTPLELLRLVGWRLRERSRQAADALGGFRRMDARGQRWAERWGREVHPGPDGLGRWLTRPGAGSLWIPVAHAGEWACATWTPTDQRIADDAARGILDVLGSGPVQVGETPAWRVDLYSGREWPLRHSFRIGFQQGDGSDIRTVWEMSRCMHLLPLARAFWHTGDTRYRDTFTRHVASWLAQNPLGRGPNWATPMEVALRAANWVVALLLFASANGISLNFWQQMLANLFATGLFLERYPEWHPVYRGNHYVADGVGLTYLGALFRDSPAGLRWLERGAQILTGEMERQVHEDGTSFEASLGYHRLVTELFTYGGEVVRSNLPEALPQRYEQRLRQMYGFIAAYLPSSGEAPMLGDADDGRLHAVCAEGWLSPRRHRLGLRTDHWPGATPSSAAFPQGGFYVLRSGTDHLIVRCGAVGLRGAGSHDHNDHLSFELVVGGRRIVADSGTYAYTRDLSARYAFRSTAAHSVVQVGGEEQNPIRLQRPWRVLLDRTQTECLRWELADDQHVFEGRHFGYAHRPSGAVCHRRILACWSERRWEVTDEVVGTGVESLTWRLHLAPTEIHRLSASQSRQELLLPGCPTVRLIVSIPRGCAFAIGESWASDRYGTRYRRPCLDVTGSVALPARIETTFLA